MATAKSGRQNAFPRSAPGHPLQPPDLVARFRRLVSALLPRHRPASQPGPEQIRLEQLSFSLYEHWKRQAISSGLWICDPFEDERRCFAWVVPPFAMDSDFRILANGEPCPIEPVTAVPPHVQDIFDRFSISDRSSRYTVEFTIPASARGEHVVLSCAFPGHRDCVFANYFRPANPQVETPVPNMMRVARTENFRCFTLMGHTQYRHLCALIDTYAPRARDVLDWGCGALRIGRFFADDPRFKFTGADVDRVNIDWCRQTFPGRGSFALIAPCEKTPFPDGSFDVIYGISIFTHLNRESERFWLAELRRLLKPGGLAVMTIHGEIAFFKSVNDPWTFRTLIDEGFYDYGACPDLDVDGKKTISEALYRNVFHTRPHLQKVWGEYFEIRKIIPGRSTAHQDYVVMTRK
jgi:SAM-dependent methyltransferase